MGKRGPKPEGRKRLGVTLDAETEKAFRIRWNHLNVPFSRMIDGLMQEAMNWTDGKMAVIYENRPGFRVNRQEPKAS